VARPRVYTNEQIIAALQETKGLVFLAAKRVGCDPDTIYNRAKRSPEVAKAIKNQRGEVVDTAELKLYQAILNGEPWSIAMVLKTLGKDRGYVEKQQHEHKGNVEQGGTVEHVVIYVPDDSRNPPAAETGTVPPQPG
jgi:hypothetical protein